MPLGLRICKVCRDDQKVPVEQAYMSGSRKQHMIAVHPTLTWSQWDDDTKRRYFRKPTPPERAILEKFESAERNLYDPIREILHKKFSETFGTCHLERTERGQYTNELKQKVPKQRDILFAFGRRALPDLTGWVERESGKKTEFITVEVEDKGAVKLDDIYQAKKYAELWGAKYGLFITEDDLPEEVRRLHGVANIFYSFGGAMIYYAQYGRKSNTIPDKSWFPENPFSYETGKLRTKRDEKPTEIAKPHVSEEPKLEDLQLKGAYFLGNIAARLHLENLGLRAITINHYSIDKAERKVFAPAVLIDAGLSGALKISPNIGTKFERGKSYLVRVWSRRGTLFQFTVTFQGS